MASTVITRVHGWETVLAGKWRDLGDSALQDALEAAFVAGVDGYHFEARGWKYEVDFQRMVQINLSTKRERDLRRLPLSPTDPKPAAPATTTAPVMPLAPLASTVAAAPVRTKTTAPLPVPVSATTPPGPPPRAVDRKPKKSGKVKSFLKDKGYGFIALDDATEVFFHVSAVQGDRSVGMNDTVEYCLSQDRSGRKRASTVSLVKKAPIMRLICRNAMCRSKHEDHFEDRCPRGGFPEDDISIASTSTRAS